MRKYCRLVIVLSIVLPSWPIRAFADAAPPVVVLANASQPDSMELARYYLQARDLPEDRLIALPLPKAETIDWSTYVEQLHNPLIKALVENGFFRGTFRGFLDPQGRHSYLPIGGDIEYLVVCKGVPLRIRHEKARLTTEEAEKLPKHFQTNEAAVDAELALVGAGGHPITGAAPNELFRNERPIRYDRMRFLKVGRLDGPTFDDARALIDRALLGEQTGLLGRAYVDKGGPHKQGNDWMEEVRQLCERLGFDTQVDDKEPLMSWSDRFEAPALYFGWWKTHIQGPLADDRLRLPPAAIAFHLHSFSSATVRRIDRHWMGGLVRRGTTVTLGNVFEPYLQLTHHPHLFLARLAEGRTAGEAAIFSLPALSWQNVLIGDPLYRPFQTNLEAQLQMGEDDVLPEARPYQGYAWLRAAKLAYDGGRASEAVSLLREGLEAYPNLSLRLALADILTEQGDPDGAAEGLVPILDSGPWRSDEWAGVASAADRMMRLGQPAAAADLLERLLVTADLPNELHDRVVEAGLEAAQQARDRRAIERFEAAAR